MFSQYSWWDFIKFVLVLAVPYYAYVLIKYYREDIREWISNRGRPTPAPANEQLEEEELSSRFVVNDYSTDKTTPSTSGQSHQRVQPAEWIAPPATSVGSTSASQDSQYQAEIVLEQEDVELQGPEVNEEKNLFGLPILIQAENPDELSIDEVRSAAERLTADEQGRVSPLDNDDKQAARIADVINQQKENPLDAFAFNR